MWVQDTLTDRQDAMKAWDAQTTDLLEAAAGRLGLQGQCGDSHRSGDDRHGERQRGTQRDRLEQNWTTSQLNFQKAFTNQQYIESEGSWGIHNWDYARTVILKAMDEAKAVTSVRRSSRSRPPPRRSR